MMIQNTLWYGTASVAKHCFHSAAPTGLSHINTCKEDWGANLTNLVTTWADLCVKGLLILGHVSHTFLPSLLSLTLTTFDPVATIVSAVNLHLECLPFLLKGLANFHPVS
jgi:hypothetical protein